MSLVSVNLPKETKDKVNILLDKANVTFDDLVLRVVAMEHTLENIDKKLSNIEAHLDAIRKG